MPVCGNKACKTAYLNVKIDDGAEINFILLGNGCII